MVRSGILAKQYRNISRPLTEELPDTHQPHTLCSTYLFAPFPRFIKLWERMNVLKTLQKSRVGTKDPTTVISLYLLLITAGQLYLKSRGAYFCIHFISIT